MSLPGVLLATGLATSVCYWLLATTPINAASNFARVTMVEAGGVEILSPTDST